VRGRSRGGEERDREDSDFLYYFFLIFCLHFFFSTSCSTPVWGGIISLLNSYRLNNNKAPLGYVVPLLYQAYASDPTIYTDVTTGNNKCTESCCTKDYGYEATTGWDPVCYHFFIFLSFPLTFFFSFFFSLLAGNWIRNTTFP
jgi:subtilase family serine protease